MAKMGRPNSENPKKIKFTFRMDAHENEMLEEICIITGENRNEATRSALKMYYEYLKCVE